jgi:hypothetical protein
LLIGMIGLGTYNRYKKKYLTPIYWCCIFLLALLIK